MKKETPEERTARRERAFDALLDLLAEQIVAGIIAEHDAKALVIMGPPKPPAPSAQKRRRAKS